MKSKISQASMPKYWYEMGLSDMPQKQPVIAWILRVTVGTALGASLALALTVPNLPQFKSHAQVNSLIANQQINNIYTPQAAATASLSLSPASGDFRIGEIFPIDIQLNTGGAQIVAPFAFFRFGKKKNKNRANDTSGPG